MSEALSPYDVPANPRGFPQVPKDAAKPKRVTRSMLGRHRQRPGVKAEMFKKRQRECSLGARLRATGLTQRFAEHKQWLETHVWHAKRMHMTEIWGHRLVSCVRQPVLSSRSDLLALCRPTVRPPKLSERPIAHRSMARSSTMRPITSTLSWKGLLSSSRRSWTKSATLQSLHRRRNGKLRGLDLPSCAAAAVADESPPHPSGTRPDLAKFPSICMTRRRSTLSVALVRRPLSGSRLPNQERSRSPRRVPPHRPNPSAPSSSAFIPPSPAQPPSPSNTLFSTSGSVSRWPCVALRTST